MLSNAMEILIIRDLVSLAARYRRGRHEVYVDVRVQAQIVKHLGLGEDRNSVQAYPGNTSSFAK